MKRYWHHDVTLNSYSVRRQNISVTFSSILFWGRSITSQFIDMFIPNTLQYVNKNMANSGSSWYVRVIVNRNDPNTLTKSRATHYMSKKSHFGVLWYCSWDVSSKVHLPTENSLLHLKGNVSFITPGLVSHIFEWKWHHNLANCRYQLSVKSDNNQSYQLTTHSAHLPNWTSNALKPDTLNTLWTLNTPPE